MACRAELSVLAKAWLNGCLCFVDAESWNADVFFSSSNLSSNPELDPCVSCCSCLLEPRSNRLPPVFGDKVLPRYFSPLGLLGGVWLWAPPLGEWGVAIVEMKMGDGGAASKGVGLFIWLIRVFTSLSVSA